MVQQTSSMQIVLSIGPDAVLLRNALVEVIDPKAVQHSNEIVHEKALVIVVEPRGCIEFFLDIDDAIGNDCFRWLPVYWEENSLHCGPVLGRRLCFKCLFQRRLAASPSPKRLAELWQSRVREDFQLMDAAYRSNCYEVLAREILQLSHTQSRLEKFQLRVAANSLSSSFHPVLRTPGCPRCSRRG